MRAVPYCIPDILSSVIETARQVSEDRFIHAKVLDKVLTYLVDRDDMGDQPQALMFSCIQVACKALGVKDPFENEKARLNRSMLGLKKRLLAMESHAPDQLVSCVRFSLAVADEKRRVLGRTDLDEYIRDHLREAPVIDKTEELEKRLRGASKVLLIADKAGEIVADALLAEFLAKKTPVTIVVASQPVLDRALRDDAQAAGVENVALITDPGAGFLGVNLSKTSTEFQEEFAAADVIIAKGQDNYQTLCDCGREVFHIMHCNCPEIAENLGVTPGSGVITLAGE